MTTQSRGKLKVADIEVSNERDTVSFKLSRPLSDLEIQGLMTLVRQAIAR